MQRTIPYLWSLNLIFLTNVAKYFNGKPLFEQASISVHRGDRIGIVGTERSG